MVDDHDDPWIHPGVLIVFRKTSQPSPLSTTRHPSGDKGSYIQRWQTPPKIPFLVIAALPYKEFCGVHDLFVVCQYGVGWLVCVSEGRFARLS